MAAGEIPSAGTLWMKLFLAVLLVSLCSFYIWLFPNMWRSYSAAKLPFLERLGRTSLSVVLAPVVPVLMLVAAACDAWRRRRR